MPLRQDRLVVERLQLGDRAPRTCRACTGRGCGRARGCGPSSRSRARCRGRRAPSGAGLMLWLPEVGGFVLKSATVSFFVTCVAALVGERAARRSRRPWRAVGEACRCRDRRLPPAIASTATDDDHGADATPPTICSRRLRLRGLLLGCARAPGVRACACSFCSWRLATARKSSYRRCLASGRRPR